MLIYSRLALIVFAAATVASAQPGGPFGRRPPSPFLTALDTDRDGTVSAAELKRAAASLGSLDANKDGVIGEDEARPQFGRGGGREGGREGGAPDDLVRTLLGFDANADGKLEKSEVPERMQGLFARGDQNQDGVLNAEELKALAGRQQQQDPARRGMPMDSIRSALDTDHDGVVSQAELAQAPAALAKLDRNQDGALTDDEVRPAMGGMRGGGGPRGNPAEMYKRLLEENDANKDGKLAVSELPERMREFLGRADSNGDGFVTPEEMSSMRREGGRERRHEDR